MAASPTTNISFQNFFTATLQQPMTSTDTDCFLDVVPNGTEGFLVINPDSATKREIIYYTNKSATKVICPSVADGRGQDDTTATSHEIGETVIMAPIAAYYETLLALFQTSPQGWTGLGASVTAVTYNGNRSYSLSVNADLTASVSNGMRIRTARTTSAPTQCTSLNGTTQFWSKAAPAGMTFTDDFVAGAWIKLSSYAAGGIISRYNGTSGWLFNVNASGQLVFAGLNAGSGNYRQAVTYQSIPLNKWVHVAAQLDMSAYTATPTTCYIMIDGVDAPVQLQQAGTNPTALIQAGNLEVGSINGGTFFPGKIAQAFVTSAKLTQTQVRAIYSQGITTADTATYSMISAYSFNNSINDLNTTNANNLTANGSAVATNADSPFTQNSAGVPGGTYDYGIVTGITASTITVQVPEGCTIPTSGGVASASYSTYKAPYGFPTQRQRWWVEAFWKTADTQVSPTASTWYNINSKQLNAPVGDWAGSWQGVVGGYKTATTGFESKHTLSTANNSESDSVWTVYNSLEGASGTIENRITVNRQHYLSLSSATVYYLNSLTLTAASISLEVRGDLAPTVIRLELTHL